LTPKGNSETKTIAKIIFSCNKIGEFTIVLYNWTNPDYSAISDMFQNGGLTQKSQFGLKDLRNDTLILAEITPICFMPYCLGSL
jgi:hypothetical protein